MADDLGHITEQIKGVANDNKRVSEESVVSFRQAANDNSTSMANFTKDLNSYFVKQKNDLQNLTDAVESSVTETQNVARKIDNTNELLQNSINIQRQMLGELTGVSGTLNDLLTEEKGKKFGETGGLGASSGLSALSELKSIFLLLTRPTGLVIAGTMGILYGLFKMSEKIVSDPNFKKLQERDANKTETEQQQQAVNDVGSRLSGGRAPASKGSTTPPINYTKTYSASSAAQSYSASSAAQLASQAGATPEESKILGAIAMAESSGNPNSHNTKGRDNSYGLWQINLYGNLAGRVKEFGLKSPDDLFDPQNNAKAAVRILRQQGFTAWSTYSRGDYKKYLNQGGESGASNQTTTNQNAASNPSGGHVNPTWPTQNLPAGASTGTVPINRPNTSQVSNSMISGDKSEGGSINFRSGVNRNINKGIADKVKQIEGMFGNLTITSGYRSPSRNEKVGGAKNSAHMRGNAVDVSFGGGEEATLKLIEAASKAGIGGIGVYRPGVVHLDTESRRAWGPSYHLESVPSWAKGAIQAHLSGKWGEYDASAKGGGKETEGGGAGESGRVSNDNASGYGGGTQMNPAAMLGGVIGGAFGGRGGYGGGTQMNPAAMLGGVIGGAFGGRGGSAIGTGVGSLLGNLVSKISAPAPGQMPQPVNRSEAQQQSTPANMAVAPTADPRSQSPNNRENIPGHSQMVGPDWADRLSHGLWYQYATMHA